MATLLLQSAGSFLGGAIGGPFGAALGRLGGSLLGASLDQALFGGRSGKLSQGPRLETMPILTCEEGASIPRIYGRVRVGGQIIWASRFEEQSVTTRSASGGKFSSKSAKSTTSYQYYANFAVALCEGPITQLRRIWADGKELDQEQINFRVYHGTDDQMADPLLLAKEGWGVPAFRGTAYIVFEHFPITEYGNRIPQLSFEVVRAVHGLGERIQGVNLIPGSTEYGYATSKVMQLESGAATVLENRHQLVGETDWAASIDALQALCPNLKSVVLVVSWFGDDLRAGQCSIAPRVERNSKQTAWNVAGLNRTNAREVSQLDGKPAYGGTPTDASVLEAIADLKGRGLSVVFSPFLMMDVPAKVGREDRFPWRGQISCDPPPGAAGTVHGTIEARRQIERFFGSNDPPVNEWSYRRFILHYAKLCARSAGVDAFLLGSELVSLTPVDDGVSEPAVDALMDLASAAKQVLGPQVKVSYAANWTEYGAWSLDGRSFKFPLDRLWSSANIDFIGIDFYPPLTDWRDGTQHADTALARSIYDRDYLRSRLRGGEAFDWYYRDSDARKAQRRLPISDTDYNEVWMFRPKDLFGWWSHQHFPRDAGTRRNEPTSWVPKSKPIWLIECGCAAIDRASNAPHIFFDAKAGAVTAPYFSRAGRDDLIQEAVIEAVLDVYGSVSQTNPISPSYGGPMIDPSRIHLWSWDARPFPAFPSLNSFWSDAGNWAKGHWLNGRLESMSLQRLLRALWSDFGAGNVDVSAGIDVKIDGYCIDHVMSLRDAVEPLSHFFRFDLVNDVTQARVTSRREVRALIVEDDDLVLEGDEPFEVSFDQSIDLPQRLELGFCDGEDHYSKNSLAISHEGISGRQVKLDLPVVMSAALAQKHGEDFLQDLACARETVSLKLRPGLIGLQIGDVICAPRVAADRKYQIERITDGDTRHIIARAVEPQIFSSTLSERASRVAHAPRLALPPSVYFIELPAFAGSSTALQFAAVTARQWLGPSALWRQFAGSYRLEAIAAINATSGILSSSLAPALPQIIRPGPCLLVDLISGSLQSDALANILAGANRAAVQHADGNWELIAFTGAKLLAPGRYELSGVLRGIGGSDVYASRAVPMGSAFVLFDDAVVPLALDLTQRNQPSIWRVGLATQDYSSSSFKQLEANLQGFGLIPLSPVQLSAVRVDGAVQIKFIRRSRSPLEMWDAIDVPLVEDVEAYEIDIFKNGSHIRTLTSSVTSIQYPQAFELEDFGAIQTTLVVKLYQMSALLGRGLPASETLSIL